MRFYYIKANMRPINSIISPTGDSEPVLSEFLHTMKDDSGGAV